MKKNFVVAALAALGVAACAGTTDLPRSYAFDSDSPEGLAVVSLSVVGKDIDQVVGFEYRMREVSPHGETPVIGRPRYDSAVQHARAVHDPNGAPRAIADRVPVAGAGSAEPLDLIENGRAVGRLAVLRLPPGDYEFHGWALTEKMPGGAMEYGPARDFTYRFHVEPGKAAYLGRLSLQLSGHATQRLTVEDRRAEDLALLAKKHPDLSKLSISSDVRKLLP